MKTNVLFGVALMLMMTLVGCKKSPNEPVPPVNVPDFTIEIKATTDTSVEFTITPADDEMTYVAMITPKAYFDTFESDNDYISDDLLWFDEIAFEQGIDLNEYLASILKTGTLSDRQEQLDPNTDYYIYAYGLSQQGKALTPLYKSLFTTLTTEFIELNFEIAISDVGYDTATLTITPDDDRATYFVNVFSYDDYEHYGGNEEAFAKHLIDLRNYYLNMGATTDQMIANLGYVGQKQLAVDKLSAGTTYIAYAIGINDDFIANSLATTTEFETLAAEQKELTFEVDITEIFYDHIVGTVTPSNDYDTYICTIQLADSLDWYETEEEFMSTIITDIEYWGSMEESLRTGVLALDGVGSLQPETDYIVACFGYNGAPTTELHVTPFTTTAATGDPNELVVSFEVSDITHNSVKVTTIPTVGVHYFTYYVEADEFNATSEELGTVNAAVAYYADWEIDYGAEWFGCSRAEYLNDLGSCLGRETSFYNQLEPSTEYVAYAIAVDMTTGELASEIGFVSEPFCTLEKIVSDATVDFIFGDYYDGSALAELDPARFLNCKGYAVMPYTVVVNDSAAAWYTGFYAGDYTEWECTDDDIYAELITYGWEWGNDAVSENRESGVAVLSYDVPFSFLGIAKDVNDAYGVGTLEVVTLDVAGVSPAEDFIAANPAALPRKAATPHHKR